MVFSCSQVVRKERTNFSESAASARLTGAPVMCFANSNLVQRRVRHTVQCILNLELKNPLLPPPTRFPLHSLRNAFTSVILMPKILNPIRLDAKCEQDESYVEEMSYVSP